MNSTNRASTKVRMLLLLSTSVIAPLSANQAFADQVQVLPQSCFDELSSGTSRISYDFLRHEWQTYPSPSISSTVEQEPLVDLRVVGRIKVAFRPAARLQPLAIEDEDGNA